MADFKTTRRVAEWLASGDTGTSSETLAAFVIGARLSKLGRHTHPRDPSDFGRCYRFVKSCRCYRQVKGISRLSPQWGQVVANWREWCRIYERDESSGRSQELYEKMEAA
jgi:hypothetical protein